MKYHYLRAERWFRWTGDSDVRSHRSPKGWEAHAHLLDCHPITGKPFETSQWWVFEEFLAQEELT